MTVYLSEHDAARLGLAGATPKKKAKAKDARPGIPRAPRDGRGEGDRVPDLMTLAAAGWTRTHYLHATGEYWLSGARGESPRCASYRAMLDTALGEL